MPPLKQWLMAKVASFHRQADRFGRSFLLGISLVTTCPFLVVPIRADVLYGTATMGDSLSIKAQPYKWPVLLQTYRGFNFGGANMPYVHAVGGATSSDVLLLREPQKVASPVSAGKVTSATFLVGGDDYAAVGGQFINGTLSGAALTSFENQIVSNIETATNIVLNSGIEGFILGSVPFLLGEPQAAPLVLQYPNAAIASDASVQRVNAQLLTFAESAHIPYVDFYSFGRLFEGLDHITVGGVDISFTDVGTDPHDFFIDNVHPGYVGNGLIANLWMEAFNIAYGTHLTLFSDQEILAMAGISGYTGETFSPTIDYASLVHFTAVPEVSPWLLLAVGLLWWIAVASPARQAIRASIDASGPFEIIRVTLKSRRQI